MWGILLLISLTKKEELSIVCFLQEDAVPQASIANIIIKYHRLKIVSVLTRQKIFLGELDSVLSERI